MKNCPIGRKNRSALGFKIYGIIFFLSAAPLGGINLKAVPVAEIKNAGLFYTLINSVDFHPKKNLFCAVYTQRNKIAFYELDSSANPKLAQKIHNPRGQLREPQHAVFSPDGARLAVANWTSQTIAIYRCREDGLFNQPEIMIPCPAQLASHYPHGISFSPCGYYLAVAYGAAHYHGKGIALFRMAKEASDCILTDLLEDLPGIPKGIAFAPNGRSLLITFSDTNLLAIYDLIGQERILTQPRQILNGPESQISRPEDIKISPDGTYCAVSNSGGNTITFYLFDSDKNSIESGVPIYVLNPPEAPLFFPHGIAFSPDGHFLAVTQFGSVGIAPDGNIDLKKKIPASQAKIRLFSLTN